MLIMSKQEMAMVTVYTINNTLTDIIMTKENAEKLRTKIQSQMNNGHAVVIGDKLLNPRYIEIIHFEEVGEDYE